MPLLSTKGKTVGKLVKGYKTTTIGQGLGSASGMSYDNYFGSGDDGGYGAPCCVKVKFLDL